MSRLCKLCGKNPATVPDRNVMSMRNVVCSECHRLRLAGDLWHILADHERQPYQQRFVDMIDDESVTGVKLRTEDKP